MDTSNNQAHMAQLTAELEQFKNEHPEEYLELLKTLNAGIDAALVAGSEASTT